MDFIPVNEPLLNGNEKIIMRMHRHRLDFFRGPFGQRI